MLHETVAYKSKRSAEDGREGRFTPPSLLLSLGHNHCRRLVRARRHVEARVGEGVRLRCQLQGFDHLTQADKVFRQLLDPQHRKLVIRLLMLALLVNEKVATR